MNYLIFLSFTLGICFCDEIMAQGFEYKVNSKIEGQRSHLRGIN